jgi:hypothetical protein
VGESQTSYLLTSVRVIFDPTVGVLGTEVIGIGISLNTDGTLRYLHRSDVTRRCAAALALGVHQGALGTWGAACVWRGADRERLMPMPAHHKRRGCRAEGPLRPLRLPAAIWAQRRSSRCTSAAGSVRRLVVSYVALALTTKPRRPPVLPPHAAP